MSEAKCPVCTGPVHPYMAKKWRGCCSDMCWHVQDAEIDRDRYAAALKRIHNEGDNVSREIARVALELEKHQNDLHPG